MYTIMHYMSTCAATYALYMHVIVEFRALCFDGLWKPIAITKWESRNTFSLFFQPTCFSAWPLLKIITLQTYHAPHLKQARSPHSNLYLYPYQKQDNVTTPSYVLTIAITGSGHTHTHTHTHQLTCT